MSGTGEPGDTVVVTIGSLTQTTTINAEGTWAVSFPGNHLPPDGDYSASVVVTTPEGVPTTLDGPDFVIDMTPPDVSVTDGTVSVGDIENGAEYQDGVTISGQGEPGSSIDVKINGATRSTTIAADGSWSVTFTQGELPPGEYQVPVKVTATDPHGNTTVLHDTLAIDTETSVAFSGTPVAGNGVVNAAEAAGGVVLSGSAEAGATVAVSWNGTTLPATVGANGSWSVTFPSGSIPAGTYDSTAIVTSTDAAGNAASASMNLHTDTETSVAMGAGQTGGDDVVSGAEAHAGIALTGTAEAGALVAVTFQGVTRTVTAGSNGSWTANFPASDVAAGTYNATVSVTATDIAGNSATTSHVVHVDTEVTNFHRSTLSTGSDNVLNAAEAGNGLTVTGTVEPGSSVMVKFGDGSAHAATVAADGTWTLTIPANEIPPGESKVTMTATATDMYGNTATLSEQVTVDTVVRDFARTGGVIGGDGMLNGDEVAAGVTFHGTVEPDSTVVVRLGNGETITTTATHSGTWTVTFASSVVPHGEVNSSVTVSATDLAGNTASFTEAFVIDTTAPGSPEVVSFSRDATGLRGIGTQTSDDALTFTQIDENGHTSTVNAIRSEDTVFHETNFRFGETVPDGSYLVINTQDVSGNESSTLLIVDNTSAPNVDLDRAGLSNFDFSAIDLTFAPEADLTITESQLLSLTGADHQLLIKGGADDTVTLVDGVATGQTSVVDGETYQIYTLGITGASVLVDDDINTSTSVI